MVVGHLQVLAQADPAVEGFVTKLAQLRGGRETQPTTLFPGPRLLIRESARLKIRPSRAMEFLDEPCDSRQGDV